MVTYINLGTWNNKKLAQTTTGYDLEPDEFYFNFGKHSGKFVFTQDQKIVQLAGEDVFITPTITNNKITAFQVKTYDGYTQ